MTRELSATALLDVLDELAQTVEGAKSSLIGGDVKVNKDDVLNLINELRAGLPGAIEKADALHAQAETELVTAQKSAEDTIATARARAIELVQQESVVEQAKQRASEIVDEAYNEAAGLRQQADQYCDDRLAQFEGQLAALGQQVQAGRAKLAERLAGA